MKEKNPFCVSSKKKYFKDNNKPAHWVGLSKLVSLYIYEFFKRTPKFDEKESSVTGKKEEDKNTAKKTTCNADTNAEDNEIIHKYKEKVVTIEEEKQTLEYQKTMILDITTISNFVDLYWKWL